MEEDGKGSKTAIQAPTGSPSNSLGGDDTESSTSAFFAAQRLITAKKEGRDWEINETVIDGEHPENLYNERKTGTPIRSDSSVSHSLENGGSDYTYHPPSLRNRLRWLLVLVVAFFNQKFDDPRTELGFRWYSTRCDTPIRIVLFLTLNSVAITLCARQESTILVLAFLVVWIVLTVNWILYLALNLSSTSKTLYGQVLYYGGYTLRVQIQRPSSSFESVLS
ncbi:hypothetical protein D9757_010259 [Collybiopsis confluens]|uniref:Uncharacterized protein n=1 Tax=Collybiopsis confluens TaxID=2823264 RepID=A0A8H5HB38_9AGAR|nr:hypothetical protein D9757_010259 [Collybiopsis confluens]